MIFKVDDIWLARSLHKLLHTLKFHVVEDDSFTSHSSQLSNIILDGIIKYYIDSRNEEEVKMWQKWRVLGKDRMEFKVIVNQLKKEKGYIEKLKYDEKIEVLKDFYSPFKISRELELELLDIVSE